MPGRRGEVAVEPFRERVLELLRRGLTAPEIAARAGYFYAGGTGNGSRLLRDVGLRHDHSHGKRRPPRRTMTYEVAVRLCRALDLDPWEAGL